MQGTYYVGQSITVYGTCLKEKSFPPDPIPRLVATWADSAPNYQIFRVDDTTGAVTTVSSGRMHRASMVGTGVYLTKFIATQAGVHLLRYTYAVSGVPGSGQTGMEVVTAPGGDSGSTNGALLLALHRYDKPTVQHILYLDRAGNLIARQDPS